MESGSIYCKEHGLMDSQCCRCVHKTISTLEAKLQRTIEVLDYAEHCMDLFAFGDFGAPENTLLVRNQENFKIFLTDVRQALKELGDHDSNK